jgi:hypothetical protein
MKGLTFFFQANQLRLPIRFLSFSLTRARTITNMITIRIKIVNLFSCKVNVIFFDARKGIPSCVLFRGMVRNRIPRMCICRILVPRNGIPRCILFRRRVRNRIMGFSFYFFTTERNSELFSLPRKGSERNSEIFCSAEQPEFRRK